MKFIYCLCGVALLFLCSLENAAVTVSASERETKHATCVCLYMHHAACMHAILKRSARIECQPSCTCAVYGFL